MGMDVYGQHPTSDAGSYFRNNVWWWRPLWIYCEEVASDIIPGDNLGHSNDGWGLDAAGALALAERLQHRLKTGEVARYETERDASLAALADELCDICGGTGFRAEPPQPGPGSVACNGCESTGSRRPFETWYPFTADNVQEWVTFLRDCGGFEIC